jgi:hypothetical protein
VKYVPDELAGVSPELLVLKHPEVAARLLRSKFTEGQDRSLRRRLRGLARQFDALPFRCACDKCQAVPAQRLVVSERKGTVRYRHLCVNCGSDMTLSADPVNEGAVSTYERALNFVEFCLPSPDAKYAEVIQSLAKCKGLADRAVTDRTAARFFGQPTE